MRDNVFKDFTVQVKSSFNVTAVSVYSCAMSGDAKLICGESIDRKIVNERYCRFNSTVVITAPESLPEAPKYMSRLVTRIVLDSTMYMIALSSYALEAFKGETAQRVLQMLRELELTAAPVKSKTPRPEKSPRPTREKRELPKLNPKAIKIAAIAAVSLVLVVGAVYLISTLDFETPVSDTDTDDDKPPPTHYLAPEPTDVPAPEPSPSAPPTSPATSPPTSPATSPPTADVTQPTLTESPTQPPPSSAGTSRPNTPTKPPTSPTTSPPTTKKPTPTQPPTVNVGTPKISASKSNNSVTLSWAAITDADGYEVSRSTSMIGGYSVLNAIAVRDGSTIKVTDSGTNSGTTYYYSVRAFRNVGGVKNWGSHSEIVTVRG
ncbi:MAG: fibronectin type III domain-containing protein [Oscillospiraceae bacterium]|nr:fibronectin type III domain-containing protein [Oscillospiraceae bacterium]